MKGAIFYYSLTGNTRLACEYLAQNVRSVDFDLIDIRKPGEIDFAGYDVCGFACSTDFMKPPALMREFVQGIPEQQDTPAFLLTTNAGVPGKTLPLLKSWVKEKGFHVMASHSLFTPESYPPLRAVGRTHQQHPTDEELAEFKGFVENLSTLLEQIGGSPLPEIELKSSLYPFGSGPKSRALLSRKRVNPERCNECSLCEKECPHQAIKLDPKPVFDHARCQGCWACYNRCPQQAVYTWYMNKSRYPGPDKELRRKLQVE
ncbi:MAG: EFR1 family ferrodoxin [Candidatus Saccharibacteria bacterium]